MQFKSLLLVASAVGIVSAVAFPDALPEALPEAFAVAEAAALKAKSGAMDFAAEPLEKRVCRNNGCTCKKGTKQGQYCGSCQQVVKYGSGGNILENFECNSQGGCCDYGKTTKCENYQNAIKYCPA